MRGVQGSLTRIVMFFVGTGKTIPDASRCPRCVGKGITHKTHSIEVSVEQDSVSGKSVTLTGESDEELGALTGDITVTFVAITE